MNTKNKREDKRVMTKSVTFTGRQLDMAEEIRAREGFATFTMVIVSALALYYKSIIGTNIEEK